MAQEVEFGTVQAGRSAAFWVGFGLSALTLGVYGRCWYYQRIKRAQRLGGIPRERQINPTTAFLLMFPGAFFIVPYFVHFWYVTKHQNMAMRAAGGLPQARQLSRKQFRRS